jgi:DNA-directed RNA polymerase subunit F
MFNDIKNLELIVENIYNELLLENRINRYLPMFAKISEKGDGSEFVEDVKSIIDVFKKDNRIVWMLKQYRNNIVNSSPRRAHTMLDAQLEEFKHFYSMGISKIDNFQNYDNIDVNNLLAKFDDWEKENKVDDEWVPISEDITPIIDYKNGWVWYSLNKEYCRLEGGAMGHCGNTAAWKSGDTILSLRFVKNVNGVLYGRPSLTFIRHGNGYLGETKGRANEKPNEKYHNMIVDLLLTKNGDEFYIQGIEGGGYAPDKNFLVSDLSPELRQKLFEQRPEFRTLRDIYEMNGSQVTNDLVEAINNVLEKYKKKPKSVEYKNGRAIVSIWNDWEDLYNDVYQMPENIANYAPYVKGDEFFEVGEWDIDRSSIEDLYNSMNVDKDALREYIVEKYGEDAEIEDLFEFLYDNDDQIIDEIKNAIYAGHQSGSESEMYKYFARGFDDLVLKYENPNDPYGDRLTGYVSLTNNSLWEPMSLVFDIDEFLTMVEERIGFDDNAEVEGDMVVPRYGFSDYDESAAKERLKEDQPYIFK